MASGITVHEELKAVYNQFKMGSVDGKKVRCLFCRISDDLKTIVIEKMAHPLTDVDFSEEYQKTLGDLGANECRYIVYDLPVIDSNNARSDKLVLISWAPEEAPVKMKMLYAASKDGLKKALDGVKTEVHICDRKDLTYKSACERLGLSK